jgi:hypothetical protein
LGDASQTRVVKNTVSAIPDEPSEMLRESQTEILNTEAIQQRRNALLGQHRLSRLESKG